jgi:RNA polymerase sigma factor (sigma-70 family)
MDVRRQPPKGFGPGEKPGGRSADAIQIAGFRHPESTSYVTRAFLVNKARAILRSRPDLVETVVQEASLNLWLAPEIVSMPEAYASASVRNAAYTLLRKEKAAKSLAFVSLEEVPESRKDSMRDDRAEAEVFEKLLEIWFSQVHDRILEKLGPKHAVYFRLSWDGWSLSAIAKELGLSRPTLYNYRAQIRALISAFEPDPPSPPSGGDGTRAPPGKPSTLAHLEALQGHQRRKEKKVHEEQEDVDQQVVRLQAQPALRTRQEVVGMPKPNPRPVRIGPHRPATRPGGDQPADSPLLQEFRRLLLELPGLREDDEPSGWEPKVRDGRDILAVLADLHRRQNEDPGR